MLLAVEGGGFFSSSASGYSKGLTLLLLGRKNDDRPMRVLPWNQYQLVDRESDPNLQLASTKNHLAGGCAAFVCFGRSSKGVDTPSPLKVGPAQQQDVVPGSIVLDVDKDSSAHTADNENNTRNALKSSMKKPQNNIPAPAGSANENEAPGEWGTGSLGDMRRKKVRWMDSHGNELVEIREFEPSEVDGSDDEFGSGNHRSCSCTIM